MRVERILAPNPGPFTATGTNSYVISSAGKAIVLDPGPVIDEHVAAVETALRSDMPTAVIVTHSHPDHAPAANVLGDRLGIDVLGFSPGPEFEPTRLLSDREVISVGDVDMTVLHTPGHTPDHLCYQIADVVFTGDHIMGGSSVVIEDAAVYMASLHRVAGLHPAYLYPGHGPEIPEASNAITWYIEHRLERERQIVDAVSAGAGTVEEIVAVVYAEVEASLTAAASYQVRVQLKKLTAEGRVAAGSLAEGGPMQAFLEESKD